MPTTLHQVLPGQPERFERWLEPGDEPKYGYLMVPGIAAVKFFVVYCPPNDEVAAVFEKGLPLALTPNEIEDRKVEFFKRFDFTQPSELLPWDKPYTITLDESIKNLGVKVTHRAHKDARFE